MSERLDKYFELLKFLANTNTKNRKVLLEKADRQLINCICECAYNVFYGNIDLTPKQKKALRRYKSVLQELINDKNRAIRRKRNLLVQKGGFLPVLLAPIIGLAASLIGEFVEDITKNK